MRYLVPLIMLISSFPALLAQQSVWDSWDKEIVIRSNTAADNEYLNEEEKKVVLFMNLARADGALFAETFLTEYINVNGLEKNKFVKSLYQDLKKTGYLKPFIPENDLISVAQGHAMESGKSGHTGHKDFKKRFEPFMGNPYQHVGENCSYGYNEAIDIVISLLIDDGVKDLGHRKNILSDSFNSVGVAIRPHKSFRSNCVIDFGKQSRSDLNEVPY